MKRLLSTLLACVVVATSVSALAAQKAKPNYSLSTKGATVLQDLPDREIKTKTDAVRHDLIPGESPTTGQPWEDDYLPMIVQIGNSPASQKIKGRSIKSAGIGKCAPWGGQYADIVFEGIIYRTGATRMAFLFSGSFVGGQPVGGVGPVSSARIGHMLLREEWQSGFIYSYADPYEDNLIKELFRQSGADERAVLFNLLGGDLLEYKNRVAGLEPPDNYNVDVVGMRSLVPTTYVSQPRPFLFADESPYASEYEIASTIHLDWGSKEYISHFKYDEAENLYERFCGQGVKEAKWAPYMTFASAEDLSAENKEQMLFANLIIQRIEYEYADDNSFKPSYVQSIGKGNADIFIGGRYIPGYWVRKSIQDPTVFYDEQGNELLLNRGKTFIAQFPPESLCTFTGTE